MVGCNLRFHPTIQKAKKIVDKEKPLWVRAETGYYLPWWRKTDYRQSYSASEYGGVVIDAIHEPDYLYWFFDKIKIIKTVCDKVSDLQIRREDISETAIVFENGVVASVHCDYLMKKYHRKLYLYYPTKRYEFTIRPTNEMYFNEIKYFLNCLKTNTKPMNGVEEAGYVLEQVWSGCGNNTGTPYVYSFTS